jgi:hypothetical protein
MASPTGSSNDTLRERFGNLIQTVAITHPDSDTITLEGLPVLSDTRNEFARTYAPQRGSDYLVRPDGYVGYRAAKFRARETERLSRANSQGVGGVASVG